VKPCDTGSDVSVMKAEFPTIDFAELDPAFPSKAGKYAYSREAIEGRAADFLEWAYNRPEKVIAVVCHAGFLRVGLVHHHFMNADYRIYDFKAEPPRQGEDWLEEWPETKGSVDRVEVDRDGGELSRPLSGGMKRSWPGYEPTDYTKDFHGD
jgi:hypothetical protein